ncbi:MAG TPA: helix-turn-helix domain-containing protein [Armatimonadota bacterium]|nr:helix-turn-helix domain-containing protein [Armatimonadota bacterium]
MPTEKATLITHPVRARILTALMGRRLTTQQLGQLLPDLPLSSIYRHVRLLVEGGIIAAVDEARVNGAATKLYAVRKGEARLSPEDRRQESPAEQLSHFTSFMNTLSDLYRAYLETEGADPSVDPVHGLMGALYLSPDEYREFMDALQEFLEPWTAKPAGGERRRMVFAHLAIPDRPDPPLS